MILLPVSQVLGLQVATTMPGKTIFFKVVLGSQKNEEESTQTAPHTPP
jgi:hypothetical protein